jgi:hypothetical protein
MLERSQRSSSVKRAIFMLVEAWQTDTSWLTISASEFRT